MARASLMIARIEKAMEKLRVLNESLAKELGRTMKALSDRQSLFAEMMDLIEKVEKIAKSGKPVPQNLLGMFKVIEGRLTACNRNLTTCLAAFNAVQADIRGCLNTFGMDEVDVLIRDKQAKEKRTGKTSKKLADLEKFWREYMLEINKSKKMFFALETRSNLDKTDVMPPLPPLPPPDPKRYEY